MRCAIMQPTYIPWAGYYNLIASVDVFVFLDDVQYARKTWQCKNRISRYGKVVTLEVPVIKAPLQTRFDAIEVDNSKPWVDRHLQEIETAYMDAEFKKDARMLLQDCLENTTQTKFLVDLNIAAIAAVCAKLGISTKFARASELNCDGTRSDHVAAICSAVGAQTYVSPEGARAYLAEDQFEKRHPFALEFQQFVPDEYPQLGHQPFQSHLSIIDVIAQIGPKHARSYVRA